ncbi:MAG TPA: sigma-70 family RNA polymerase sigma factor [Ilumatobacteraceae bacterium]|jgi:RNA polymerase sigma-70 factor (ECF subfamily)
MGAVETMDFEQRTDPYRRELLAHCYRMLGSVHDAEDLLQDTMLRAWRSFDRYDETRATMRTWLYRIATNACLTALQGRQRRPLPSQLSAPWPDTDAPLVRGGEVPWLQPIPDVMSGIDALDPALRVIQRGSLRLAFVAALQHLPARQRAVLIMRDVLMWSAAEVAEALDTTTVAVNSTLQRAHARMGEMGLLVDDIAEPSEAACRAMVDRYVDAFERADIAALTRLLTDDVVMEMPPIRNWFQGRQDYGRFIARSYSMRGLDWKMIPTMANGQPACVAYTRAADGGYRIHTLQVFTVRADGICHTTVFQDEAVFAIFELPPTLPAA